MTVGKSEMLSQALLIADAEPSGKDVLFGTLFLSALVFGALKDFIAAFDKKK